MSFHYTTSRQIHDQHSSDHRLKPSDHCPSCTVETYQFNPDGPIHSSASCADFWIPDIWGSDDDCSQSDRERWMKFAGESLSFDGCTPLGPSDKSVQSPTSDSELANLLEYPSNDPLAGLTHESQSFPLSEIGQSTSSATTEDSPSQRFSNFIIHPRYAADIDPTNNSFGLTSTAEPPKTRPSSVSASPSSLNHRPFILQIFRVVTMAQMAREMAK